MDDATLSLANALARMAGIDLGAENLTQQLDLASANEETRSFAEALRILLGLCDYTVQDGMFTSIEISANSANTAVSELRKTVEGYAASAERSREFMTGEERASAYNSNYRDMAEGIDYLQKKMQEATEDSFLEALEAALKDLDAEGILQPLAENFELIQSLVNGDIESLDELLELLEKLSEQADDMNLEALAFMGNSERESNRASENNYADQIEAMLEAFNDGGFEDMMEQWNEFDESMQRSIADSWPELIQAMYEAQEASQDLAHALEENGGVLDENSEEANAAQKAYSRLNAVLDDTTNIATSKYFRTTAKDMQSLAKGTGRLQDAVADYNKE